MAALDRWNGSMLMPRSLLLRAPALLAVLGLFGLLTSGFEPVERGMPATEVSRGPAVTTSPQGMAASRHDPGEHVTPPRQSSFPARPHVPVSLPSQPAVAGIQAHGFPIVSPGPVALLGSDIAVWRRDRAPPATR
ncbi:hypothetical protein C3Y87_15750 [Carbonactinospora thermoautotrophica]|uniref:hypothetical protein n=1 Tax=Carbonactinospora thermoautotrophica TaxID=1469144 RepID=UPI002271663E|nr:hypothetical protein [Carbonactinospora thermoautotrophica]MCX9192842.1 hypothetical protein [Carbonactinospora thermoautotrophica]